MAQDIIIALDAMGGDFGPSVVVPSAHQILAEVPNLHVIFVGDETSIEQHMSKLNRRIDSNRYTIQHATQKVEMDDLPSRALRGKKDSSMRVAINLVKDKTAHACVSAGNTGALMATARFVIKMIAGLDRPAIIGSLPTIKGHTHMLDMGANVDVPAETLFQFALMGSVLTSAVENIESPTVGLLNVGEEEIKGKESVKQASALLTESDLNYVGFVEGDDVYNGVVDVVVCDGFTGNISVKTAEGVAQLLTYFIKKEFNRNFATKLAGIISKPVLNAFKRKIDHRSYNGASLVGLQGIVIKSHGGADELAFGYAIKEAIVEVEKNVPSRIKEQLESIMSKRQAV